MGGRPAELTKGGYCEREKEREKRRCTRKEGLHRLEGEFTAWEL